MKGVRQGEIKSNLATCALRTTSNVRDIIDMAIKDE